MNHSEWIDIVEEIQDRWGASPKWTSAKTALYSQADRYDFRRTLGAVESYFAEGLRSAPSPSEVMKRARDHGALMETPAGSCQHPHYAILTYHGDGSAATGLCAGCRREFTWKAGRVRTVGDLESRDADRSAGTSPPVPSSRSAETAMISP